ncbi:sugar ABC transporter substrate-binding protein [Saccharopolyspora sp. NPDC050389]|uniref:ABC transporter substrate-binding protein n=1 Tax=Saccharopolyspora sp. NPDC050389 TaxID=3155516 RepID=UPI0033EF2702
MNMSRRRVLGLGGALAVSAGLSGLAACSSEARVGSVGDPAKGDITVWSWAGPAAEMRALVPKFNELYPGIKVTVQDIGNPAIWDKITTSMAAGGAGLADVLHIGVDYLPAYTDRFPGQLADLSALSAGKYQTAFSEGLWRTVSPKGSRIDALPWEANSGGFYYRADVFEDAGVDVDALETWDDAIEAGLKIKEKTGKHLLGIDKPASQQDSANFFQLLLQLQGSTYFNLDGEIMVSSPEAVRAMTLIKRMNDAGLVNDISGGMNALISSIKSGTAAVLPWPTWFGDEIEEAVPDEAGLWGVRLPPAVRPGGTNVATVNSTHLAISGTSHQQAAAWNFVEFVLTRPQSQVEIYKNKGIAPALLAAYEDPFFHQPSKFFSGQKKGEIFYKALSADSQAFNYTSDYARALKAVTDAQTRVLLRGADPATELRRAADQLAAQTARKVAQ